MSRQVNSEAILPNDIVSSTDSINTADNSNNDNNNNTNNVKGYSNINNSSYNNSNNNNNNNRSRMPEVVVNGTGNQDDFDIDEEVMSFMHSHIHSTNQTDEVDNKNTGQGKPDDESPTGEPSQGYRTDNMPSWDAPLMSARDNALAPDDYNEALNGRISRHSECSIEADLLTERENMLEEEDAAEMAKRLETELAGSILALWQERLTQKSTTEADIDIEYASESDMGSTGPSSPTVTIPPPVQFADYRKVHSQHDPNRISNQVHPMAPVKLPLLGGDGSGNNNALEEIRSRLRKTKFDYTSDSRQRISDATPQLDYRSVLKKRGKI